MPKQDLPKLSLSEQYRSAQMRANLVLAQKLRDSLLWGQTVWSIRGDSTRPYDITDTPYLIEIMNSQDPFLVIQSGAQLRKSEALSLWGLSNADWGYNFIHAFDTDGKAYEFVRERINTNISASPYLASRSKDTDTIGQKRIGSGNAYYRGATESKAVSTSADRLVLDELDLIKPSVRALFKKRLNASSSPMERHASNPSYPGEGINAEYMASDRRKWHVRCPFCSTWAPLEWATHVEPKTGQVKCPSCKKPQDLRSIVVAGRWQATAKGPYPGYYLNCLMSPTVNIQSVLDDLNSPDENKKRAAWRMDLGLPYEDKAAGLNADEIRGCAIKRGPSKLGWMMTVDPGGVFDVGIWERPYAGNGNKLTLIWSGNVSGWDELENLERESRVVCGIIDNGPELDGARKWVMQRGGRWQRVAYELSGETGPRWKPSREQAFLTLANRTLMLDHVAATIRTKSIGLAEQYAEPSSRYSQHLQAGKRIVERGRDGLLKVVWREGSLPDHQMHTTAYALIGVELFAMQERGTRVEGVTAYQT